MIDLYGKIIYAAYQGRVSYARNHLLSPLIASLK